MPGVRFPTKTGVLAALLVLWGCGSNDRTLTVAVVGAEGVALGAHHGGGSLLLRSATAEGLVSLDAAGRVIPGLADRWIVTDDGLAYIFRLRDAAWPDGTAITGEGARTALTQAIAATAGTPLSLDLAPIADVRAMAGRVLEVRLKVPMPDLLQLLAQPELGCTHRGKGGRWAGWGPMRWQPAAQGGTLEPLKPESRGLAAGDPVLADFGPVRLVTEPADRATADLAGGRIDAVLGGSFADQPVVGVAGIRNSALRLDPVIGLFGLQEMRPNGLLATPDGREALAKAIDRDTYAATLLVPGWLPTTRIVAAGTDGDAGAVGERWADEDFANRQIDARRRVVELLGPGAPSPSLRVALPEGPGADILFARLAADWQAIGVGVVRVSAGAPADLRLVDRVARYPRAAWFLNQFACRVAAGAPCSPEADAVADRARIAADPAIAANLWAQAEQQLTASNLFIPLGAPLRWSLAGRRGGGLAANRLGIHPLAALAILQK